MDGDSYFTVRHVGILQRNAGVKIFTNISRLSAQQKL